MDVTFDQFFALCLFAAGLGAILIGSLLVWRARRTATKAVALVEQALNPSAEDGDGDSLAESRAAVDPDEVLSNAKEIISKLPNEDRFPGLLVYAGLVMIAFSLLAAGVLQVSAG